MRRHGGETGGGHTACRTTDSGIPVLLLDVQPAVRPSGQPAQACKNDLLREAEAQRALAELFPHLKLSALRAIQDLFPLQAARNAALH